MRRNQPDQETWGLWRTRGYGYLVEIDQQGIRLFCTTESFVYELPGAAEFLADGFFRRGDEPQTLYVTEHPSEGWRVLERTDPPENVRQLDGPWTPQERMQVFVETMREHYAFFDLWGVDWEDRVQQYASSIDDNSSDVELFEAVEQMLHGIDDAHFGYSAMVNGERRRLEFGKGPTKRQIRELFLQQQEFDDLNAYLNAWFQAYLKSVDHKILGGKGKSAVKNRLRWGWVADNIGYVQLTHLNGYGEAKITDAALLLADGIDAALADLDDADAMIVDLSYNQGGSDLLASTFAGRFADKPRAAFVKRPVAAGDHEHHAQVVPGGPQQYLKPVYVITSDITMSAAETLVLRMKALPHVTLVGQPTRGAFSDMLEKPLPGDALLTLSNEVYETPAGDCYEGRGIPVSFELNVFDPQDPWQGHPAAIEATRQLALQSLQPR